MKIEESNEASAIKTIWKYQLDTIDYQSINLPQGAELLTVQIQAGEPCLWVRVDPNAPKYMQMIATHGTGHMVTENTGDYIGTYQLNDGALIFHVFKAL